METQSKKIPMETIQWQIQRDEKLRSVVNDNVYFAQIENIKGQRSLVVTFITLSAGIIGFTIPIIGQSNLVKTTNFLILGLFGLLSVILFGLGYLKFILEKENKSLFELQNKYNSAITKNNLARDKFFEAENKETLEAWLNTAKEIVSELSIDPKQKPDYALDIILGLFCISLLFIILALVKPETFLGTFQIILRYI